MLATAHQEHMDVFRSLSEANPKRAVDLMRKHMEHTTNALMVRLKDRNDIIHNAIAFDFKAWKRIDQKGS
jgi:DNA-binding GntR family transcriptional regulator